MRSSPAASRGIGAREAARGEAQPRRLRSYCFLKALASYARPASATRLPQDFCRNFSASTGSQHVRTTRIRGRSYRSRQGFRRHARRGRRQPRGSHRLDLRPSRPERRRQDDDAADADRHHRSVERHAPRARPRAADRCGARRSATFPRSAASIRRCTRARRSPSWARCAACRSPRAAAAPTSCWSEHDLGDWAKKPIRTLVQGHGADRPAARHHRPQAAADRPRRALLRPRRDQPGPARRADPPRGARRRRRSSSRPTSSPMPSGCASGSRSSPRARSRSTAASTKRAAGLRPIVRLRTRASRRAVALCHPANARREGDEWVFELPEGGPEPLAQGADRRRRRNRDAGDRAARPARCLRRDRRQPGRGRHGHAGAGRNDALLRSAFVIARRDFAATVLSKAFIFFLLGPLFPLLLGGVFGGIGARSRARPNSRSSRSSVAATRLRSACPPPATQLAAAIARRDGGACWSITRRQRDLAAQQQRLLAIRDPPVRAVLTGGLDQPAAHRARSTAIRRRRPARADHRRRPRPQHAGAGRSPVTETAAPSGSLAKDRALTAPDRADAAVLPDPPALRHGAVPADRGEIEQDHRGDRGRDADRRDVRRQAVRDARGFGRRHRRLDQRRRLAHPADQARRRRDAAAAGGRLARASSRSASSISG